MPTNNPRFSISLPDDLYKAVDDYKFTHRCKNQTQAIISLITMGLAEISRGVEPPVPAKPEFEVSSVERQLVQDFRALNRQGRQYILQTMSMATHIYKNGSVPDVGDRAIE